MTEIPRPPFDFDAPTITPVPAGTSRPHWSVMIPTYNCAAYLRETLQSVLTQDPGPDKMHIEVVDDCSTKDDPEAVVREVGGGRVGFFRRSHNGGATHNFNTCVARSRGHLIHLLHGDDLVEPGFYAAFTSAFDAHPDVSAVLCRAYTIDAHGALEDLSPRVPSLEHPGRDARALLLSNPVRTPAIALRRSLYEAEGGFLPVCRHTADWEMWVRAIVRGGGLMLNVPLARYRMFPMNDTSRLMRTGDNVVDHVALIERFASLGGSSFDAAAFLRMLADTALLQADRYRDLGEAEPAAANLAVWRQLATPRARLRVGLKRLRRGLQRWTPL